MSIVPSGGRRAFLTHTTIGLGAAVLGAPATAANWPVGPVKIIVGNPAGGAPDITTRAVAEALSQRLGQPFVVDNKVGANGAIGFQALQSAPPNGMTFSYFSQYNFYAMALMGRTELLDGFGYVTRMFDSPSIVVVGNNSPYTSLSQLVEAARKSPGRINYGSGGIGTPAHIGMEKLRLATGTRMEHVPFKGGAEQAQALAGGLIDVGLVIQGSVKGLLDTGRLRPLAVTSSQRLPSLPDTPTVNEAAGLQDYEVSTWGGYVVPKGVPGKVITTLFNELLAASKSSIVHEAVLRNSGQLHLSRNPEEFAAFFASERAASLDLLRRIGLLPGK